MQITTNVHSNLLNGFEQKIENIKHSLKQVFTNTNLDDDTAQEIIELIREKIREGGLAPIKIRQNDHAILPRSIQYNPDGEIYILFNKKQDIRMKGKYKIVKIAQNLITGEQVARATQFKADDNAEKRFKNEFNISIELNGCRGCVYTFPQSCGEFQGKNEESKFSFMQKFYNSGDLQKAIKDNRKFTQEEKLIIASNLLESAIEMRKKNIVHRDFKPANILLNQDLNGKITDVVTADFGLAFRIEDIEARERAMGTAIYLAPELVNARSENTSLADLKNANNFPLDNWAIGLILYQIFIDDISDWKDLSSKPYWFEFKSFKELFYHFQDEVIDRRFWLLSWLPVPKDPKSIGHIIRGLLNPIAKKRLTAEKALDMLKSMI